MSPGCDKMSKWERSDLTPHTKKSFNKSILINWIFSFLILPSITWRSLEDGLKMNYPLYVWNWVQLKKKTKKRSLFLFNKKKMLTCENGFTKPYKLLAIKIFSSPFTNIELWAPTTRSTYENNDNSCWSVLHWNMLWSIIQWCYGPLFSDGPQQS